ncbi:MAG: AEC family transporter [Pseudomonadota bacterium]
MIGQVLSALLPAIVTIMIGYFAAWHHDFTQDDVPTLNRMVMTYALPLALFVGVFSAGRTDLLSDAPLLMFLFLAIVGTFVLVLLIAVFVFRHPPGLSALRALMASGPSAAFVGVPVLSTLYGETANIPIAAGGIIIVLFLLPTTLVLLCLDQARNAKSAADAQGTAVPENEQVHVLNNIATSLKMPIVWLPLFGVILVLLGIELPKVAEQSISLLGHSSSGVALFASGVILAGYRITFTTPVIVLVTIKNILQPAIVCWGMVALGYGQPILGETVITIALPAVALVVMLAVQFRTAIPEAASALLVSTFASIVTMTGFMWLMT